MKTNIDKQQLHDNRSAQCYSNPTHIEKHKRTWTIYLDTKFSYLIDDVRNSMMKSSSNQLDEGFYLIFLLDEISFLTDTPRLLVVRLSFSRFLSLSIALSFFVLF